MSLLDMILLDMMDGAGTTLYREPSLEEIAEKLKIAKSTGKLYNFVLRDGDKPGKAVGQVGGFLKRFREGKDIKPRTIWLMRQIEAGINSGLDLIDWDETLEMWNGTTAKPVAETREKMWMDF